MLEILTTIVLQGIQDREMDQWILELNLWIGVCTMQILQESKPPVVYNIQMSGQLQYIFELYGIFLHISTLPIKLEV